MIGYSEDVTILPPRGHECPRYQTGKTPKGAWGRSRIHAGFGLIAWPFMATHARSVANTLILVASPRAGYLHPWLLQ